MNVYNKARTLGGAGLSVLLLTFPGGEDSQIQGVTISRVPRIPLFSKVRIGPSKAKAFYDLFMLIQAVLLLQKRKDIVAIHAHEIDATLVAVLVRKIHKLLGREIPVIYDMHSIFREQMGNYGLDRFVPGRVLDSIERWAYSNCEVVLTISPLFNTRIRSMGCATETVFIPDIPGLPTEEEDPDVVSQLEPHLQYTTVAFYMGNLESYQGVDLLIEAYRSLGSSLMDLRLLVVCKEDVKDYLPLLPPGVLMVQETCLERMPAYLAQADILVSPRLEGTNVPFKIYPYMRSGKPIVATDIESHKAILDDGVTCRICGMEPKEMAEALRAIATNPALGKRLAKRAMMAFERHYSFRAYRSKVLQLYGA